MITDDWDLFWRQIDVQLDEYEAAVREAQAWWLDWKKRNRGFRCKRQPAEREGV